MFPFYDSPSPMDLPLYQQLQLSPPSPKAPDHQSLLYYHSSPPFAADPFHHNYLCAGAGAGSGAATPPAAEIDDQSPPELLLMDQAPAPRPDGVGKAQGLHGGGGLDSAAARKDRHSKICTAGGMRDRRMRLSLDVARKFFALQDMLGFDKASKTVQWLLNTSKGAIKEVMTDEASSDCEEDGSSSLSVADGKHKQPGTEAGGGDHADGKKPAPRASKRAPANPKPQRKLASAHLIPDKESRTKARERARERTREKNRMRWVTLASTINIEPATTGMAAARLDELVTSPNNLINRSSSMNTPGAELEEGCSSSMPSEAIMAGFGNGGYGSIGNYYQHQLEQQWELGGVVFANSQHY
ncbi:hypothetical protein ZWY2020_053752 [Hordeum vulgare]|uniref:Tcp transcription factor Int-C n=2 Tax=Hordeum vulgare subsp. vulgare TaxID=112509 RepID=A0A2R7Z5I1_HORVV|nr:hypothetical protein ZWY2020_053752 [Hordeum vulgare]SJL82048.1 tcp transcription factor Int-C [Hordeum vulgare subsp. vulgare]